MLQAQRPPEGNFIQRLEALILRVLGCSEEEVFHNMRPRTVNDNADTLKLSQQCDIPSYFEDKSDEKVVNQFMENLQKEEALIVDDKTELR
eukprot:907529-Lingulodinium_polyedra.AAC.1